jgi:lysophospholipase L1-like esterase
MTHAWLYVLVSLIVLTALAGAAGAQSLFVIAGQSNALGRGDSDDLKAPYDAPQTDAMYWTGSGWTPLRPGFGVGKDHGPELSLGRALADRYEETIYIVKHAAGGTDLAEDWDPRSGRQYKALRERVRAALADLGQDARVEGFFWMQGEADCKRQAYAEAYRKNLVALIAAMRSDVGDRAVAFVLGRVHNALHPSEKHDSKYRFAATVRAAQVGAAKADKRVAWVDTDAMGLNEDELHFSSAGQIALGRSMAEAWLRLREPAASEEEESATAGVKGRREQRGPGDGKVPAGAGQ